jgi:hypothetical protein
VNFTPLSKARSRIKGEPLAWKRREAIRVWLQQAPAP